MARVRIGGGIEPQATHKSRQYARLVRCRIALLSRLHRALEGFFLCPPIYGRFVVLVGHLPRLERQIDRRQQCCLLSPRKKPFKLAG